MILHFLLFVFLLASYCWWWVMCWLIEVLVLRMVLLDLITIVMPNAIRLKPLLVNKNQMSIWYRLMLMTIGGEGWRGMRGVGWWWWNGIGWLIDWLTRQVACLWLVVVLVGGFYTEGIGVAVAVTVAALVVCCCFSCLKLVLWLLL